MRIVLLYAPPWKMPLPGEPVDPVDGPPENFQPGDLDPDFFQIPYGLLTLGAQAIRAGHDVKVLNLSAYAWTVVDGVIAALEADVFGMSCWTSNRRGVALVAKAIKEYHPAATVVVGGPHVSALGKEMMEHYPAIDLACVGESEDTFLEILDRRAKGLPLKNIAGAFHREREGIVGGGERANIKDLDTLAPPHAYFDTHILMTSRGCPWQCTFCGADTTWGRGFRGNSVKYVLDEIETAIARLPVKAIQIKDDTFTTNKKRVKDLCRGVRERGLKFLWSCDTRVDVIDDDLLREMRLAGCERLSLGVESGAESVLAAMDKKVTPEEIAKSTALAKKWGIKVRYFMIVGSRGETRATLEETMRFLERVKPHQYVFSCLAIYPGTRDFHDAEAAGWFEREMYFSENFQEFMTPFDASDDDTKFFAEWFEKNKGVRTLHEMDVEECEAVLARIPDHHAAHVDLAMAYFRAHRLDDAKKRFERALELGHPMPGVVHNFLACIANERGDLSSTIAHLGDGVRDDPQHLPLLHNHLALQAWLEADGPASGKPLRLEASYEFQFLERTIQPTLPGPLAKDFDAWTPRQAPKPVPPIRPEELKRGGPRRLSVVQ